MNRGIEKALSKLEITYEVFFYQFQDWEQDGQFCSLFRAKLESGLFDCVLSVNFAPLVAGICEILGVPYVSWVYDSPVHIRNLEPMKHSCNQIYFFDRGQAQEYASQGIPANYMPLAVDTELFHQAVEHGGRLPDMELSMVGQLYKTEYAKYAALLDGYTKGYLDGMIRSQLKIYGGYLIPELLTDDLLEQVNAAYASVLGGFRMGRRELEYMLACEVTGQERYLALALLSKYIPVSLYTDEADSRLAHVRFCGYADYEGLMPKVFAASKINLNISLKTIRSGIPLRVLDIAGCGGFVMSNFQIELAEYFKVGEECEVYENLEDLLLKAKFYLEHDELRRRIAQAGLERVKRDFTFEERLGKMLRLV